MTDNGMEHGTHSHPHPPRSAILGTLQGVARSAAGGAFGGLQQRRSNQGEERYGGVRAEGGPSNGVAGAGAAVVMTVVTVNLQNCGERARRVVARVYSSWQSNRCRCYTCSR